MKKTNWEVQVFFYDPLYTSEYTFSYDTYLLVSIGYRYQYNWIGWIFPLTIGWYRLDFTLLYNSLFPLLSIGWILPYTISRSEIEF